MKNYVFQSYDRIIIRELCREPNGIDPYWFHLKWRLSLAQISSTIDFLLKRNVLQFVDSRIFLTKEGRQWAVRNRREIFIVGPDAPWKKNKCRLSVVEPNLGYRPRPSKMDLKNLVKLDN